MLSAESEPAGDPVVRVMICDDHPVLRDALAQLIASDPGLTLVAPPFAQAAPAIAAAGELAPDVVLMDVDLPGGVNGIEAARTLSTVSPHSKVLILSGSGNSETLLVEAIEAGAVGFLPKTEAAPTILSAIRTAARGEPLFEAEVLATVLRRVSGGRRAQKENDAKIDRLTGREREVLQRLANGDSNEDIATALFLSIHTVHTHVRNILTKLEFHSRLQAVVWAVETGVVAVGSEKQRH